MSTTTVYPFAKVDDSLGGYDTAVDLNQGDLVTLTSTGTWYRGTDSSEHTGPDGDTSCIFGYCQDTVDNTLPNFALLYRIGIGPGCGTTGSWSLAGSTVTFVAQTSGRLYLIANDRCTFFTDNSGYLTTTITVTTPVLDHDFVDCRTNYMGIGPEQL